MEENTIKMTEAEGKNAKAEKAGGAAKKGCLGCMGAIGLVIFIIIIICVVGHFTNPKIDNVVGMTVKEAKATLEKAGYKNIELDDGEYMYSKPSDEDIVTEQSPKAGARADEKDDVTITSMSDRAINLEKKLKARTAWAAVETYGDKEYPYGFDVDSYHWQTKAAIEDDTWLLIAPCEIENAYGNTVKGTCNAKVEVHKGEPYVYDFIVSEK